MNERGVALIGGIVAIVALLSGLYFGALNAEPILESVINSQQDRIDDQASQIRELEAINDINERELFWLNQEIETLNESQAKLTKCFRDYRLTDRTIYDAYDLNECVGVL